MKPSPLLPIVAVVCALAFAGCEKKTPDPKVEPSATDRASAAVKSAAAKTGEALETAAAKTKQVALEVKDAVSTKLVEWNLTPDEIKDDLARTGRVVRKKALVAGARTGAALDNARIVTLVKAKFVTDNRLSALKINVDADQGIVTLKGTVGSVDLIGRAVSLALDTEGVTEVVSLLTVST